MQIRRKFSLVYLGLTAIFLALVLIAFLIISPIKSVWKTYEQEVVEKQTLLLDMKSNLGYGGFIDYYFRYQLGKERSDLDKAEVYLKRVLSTLEFYGYSSLNEKEQQALDKINGYLNQYQKNLEQMKQGGQR